jgi:hypothetical protein
MCWRVIALIFTPTYLLLLKHGKACCAKAQTLDVTFLVPGIEEAFTNSSASFNKNGLIKTISKKWIRFGAVWTILL